MPKVTLIYYLTLLMCFLSLKVQSFMLMISVLDHSTPGPTRSPPQTPSHHNKTSQALRPPPETPRKQRDNHQQCLAGVKSHLPANLSLQLIRKRLITSFKLPYTPDDWQIHLIRRILQGYDSIFCAGTGYGKSLIFEALSVLGSPSKLVLVISPLKALERDQVVLHG